MNKILKYSLLAILILSIAISVYLLFFFPDKPVAEADIDDPSTAGNAPLGSVEEPIVIEEPVFMEDSEKDSFSLDPNIRIQVLERADDGTVMSYKIINSDEDIASGYYPVSDSQ